MKSHFPSIERLEDRIAPAATLTGQVLSYTDIDGDHVKITISGGPNNSPKTHILMRMSVEKGVSQHIWHFAEVSG